METDMTDALATKSKAKSRSTAPAGRLFVLELSHNWIRSMSPDGSDRKVLVTECHLPDGIAVDVAAGHIYWTNMGTSPATNDGSIERADIDGKNRKVIVPPGITYTPKQIQLDKANGKLYWCDREGMRVMRVNLDGSNLETLIETGHGDEDRRDAKNWCVGIALDVDRKQVYWTQKGPDNAGQGRIFRAGLEIPTGQTPSTRKDIELLHDALPEPIDLDLDLTSRTMYWTDRGDPPRGNTVNRAPMDSRKDPEIIFNHLMEGIGLALDLKNNRMFMTDLGGSVYSCGLDGANTKMLQFAKGNLTGIAYAEIPLISGTKR